MTDNDTLKAYMRSLPLPYFSPAVAPSRSDFAGHGLRATRNISAGEILVVERGPILPRLLIEMIERETGYETNLCIGRDAYISHGPIHPDGAGGYINHSCAPNAGLVANGVWAAITPVALNTEITCDYGTFETMPGWTMRCACGEPNCRGTITDKDNLLPELQERLGEWFAPYLKAELGIK
jgi:hypothetical protein